MSTLGINSQWHLDGPVAVAVGDMGVAIGLVVEVSIGSGVAVIVNEHDRVSTRPATPSSCLMACITIWTTWRRPRPSYCRRSGRVSLVCARMSSLLKARNYDAFRQGLDRHLLSWKLEIMGGR